jgi:hypothetical protein
VQTLLNTGPLWQPRSGVLGHALVWFLFWILPLQALGVATAELRGPAHYHDRPIGLLSGASVPPSDNLVPEARVLPAQPHVHSDVERHHHDPADEPIMVEDASDHQHDALAIEDGASSTGSLLSFAALLLLMPHHFPFNSGYSRPYWAPKTPADPVAGRLERPPSGSAG